jgi:hypothetical protein
VYRYSDYAEDGDRVRVVTQGVAAKQDLGPDMQLGVTLVNDAIAGATPTGLPAPAGSTQVPLAHLSDHRKEWELDLSRQFRLVDVAVGASESREHDYLSRGWSLNTVTDLNEKNTELLVGVAGHNDKVETFYDPKRFYAEKQSFSAIVGVTQLLDPLTSVTLNFTWSRETGYLSDQYKIVEQNVELVPGSFFPLVFAENRPGQHNSGVAYLAVERMFPALRGSLEGSFRYYSDTYGVVANTVEGRWLQKLGHDLTLAPVLRLYEQSAARFYYYNLNQTMLVPTTIPDPNGPAYSSDYRLSSLFSTTLGLELTFRANRWLEVTAAYDRYAMRGRDGVTPQSAYPRANIYSLGAKISW